MSNLSIRQYEELARDTSGYKMPAGKEPALGSENVVFTITTQSTAFATGCNMVRIAADVDARVEFGENPTADDDSLLIKAGSAEYFGVKAGHKLAVKEA